MTIREFLLDWIGGPLRKRLVLLEELAAPEVIMQAERKRLAALEEGRIKGLSEYGGLEVLSHEEKKGSGGKAYTIFSTPEGRVVYFSRWGGALKHERDLDRI